MFLYQNQQISRKITNKFVCSRFFSYLCTAFVKHSSTKLIDIDTKSRSRYFTPRFEFTYENLQAELQKAIEKQCEAENAKSTDKALDNPYAKQIVDFDTLKAENIALANRLMDSPLANEVVDLLTNMLKGVKLSEIEKSEPATTTMQVLNSSLLDLEEKLGI